MRFWVVAMAALLLGERMRRWQYIAIGVACAGRYSVLQPGNSTLLPEAPRRRFLSGVSWGQARLSRSVCIPGSGSPFAGTNDMADAICRRSNERSGLARPATSGRLAAHVFWAWLTAQSLQRRWPGVCGFCTAKIYRKYSRSQYAGRTGRGVRLPGGYDMKSRKGGRLWHCVDSTGVGDDQYHATRGMQPAPPAEMHKKHPAVAGCFALVYSHSCRKR